MSKCPYCHNEYFSSESFQAHISNCGFKDNPLPEEEMKKSDDNVDLKNLKVDELKKIAKEKNINVDGLIKAEIISKLSEAIPDPDEDNHEQKETGD